MIYWIVSQNVDKLISPSGNVVTGRAYNYVKNRMIVTTQPMLQNLLKRAYLTNNILIFEKIVDI